MSGILILLVFAVGMAVAVGVWAYGRWSRRRAGRVRPDAPPSEEEKRRARGE